MKDGDGHLAGKLVQETFGGYFPEVDPKELHGLGKSIFVSIESRVRERHLDPVHTWDIYQEFFVHTLDYLQRRGPSNVIKLAPWAKAVARNTAHHYFEDLDPRHLVLSLDDVVDRFRDDDEHKVPIKVPAAFVVWHSDEQLRAIVHEGIATLEGRRHEFAVRHFLNNESKEEVIRGMGLTGRRGWRRLYRQTLTFLRGVLQDFLAHHAATGWGE